MIDRVGAGARSLCNAYRPPDNSPSHHSLSSPALTEESSHHHFTSSEVGGRRRSLGRLGRANGAH